MTRQRRSDMIAETRGKLIAAGRHAFATKGYAAASMEDFTANAGLTRGALYHHFGDKKGLFEAVVEQINSEMAACLQAIIDEADTVWDGFLNQSIASIKMAVDPEIQRIMVLDGPAVLGDPSRWPIRSACIDYTARRISVLVKEGTAKQIDAESAAHLINGAAFSASLWIASAADPHAVLDKAINSFITLTSGLLKGPASLPATGKSKKTSVGRKAKNYRKPRKINP
nr:TetR/AcrR family transcriptional regulator [Beijerinckia sp. L45]